MMSISVGHSYVTIITFHSFTTNQKEWEYMASMFLANCYFNIEWIPSTFWSFCHFICLGDIMSDTQWRQQQAWIVTLNCCKNLIYFKLFHWLWHFRPSLPGCQNL